MRAHNWQFLLDEEGRPIEGAEVSIYLAGTTTPIYVFDDEIGGTATNTIPQIITNAKGFFQFWIADTSESNGYDSDTKIKIAWEKIGIASGYIDYVDVFSTYVPVDEYDTDTTKNKAISNNLAKLWEDHRSDTSHLVHGIAEVNTNNSSDIVKNKLISDNLGTIWNDHSTYSFGTSATSGMPASGAAHNLELATLNSTDPTENKIVSDLLLTQFQQLINSSLINKYTEVISSLDWSGSSGNYYITISHNLNENYPNVTIYNISTKKVILPLNIEMINANQIKIFVYSKINANVSVFG